MHPLREAMEKGDNRAVTAAHVCNLTEIDAKTLARAYALAEKTCTYWPNAGQIRELAGWSEETSFRQEMGRLCRRRGLEDGGTHREPMDPLLPAGSSESPANTCGRRAMGVAASTDSPVASDKRAYFHHPPLRRT